MRVRILNAWNNQVELDAEFATSATFQSIGNNYDAFQVLKRELNGIDWSAINKWSSKYDGNPYTPPFWLFHDKELAVRTEGLPLCSII